MPSKSPQINLGPGLSPREGAIDAIYRYTEGLDRADESLLCSAFALEGIVDLSGMTPRTGNVHDEMKGIESIVVGVLAHVGPMDSAHRLSNFRVKINQHQTQAEMTCYALAEHFKPGEGQDPSKRTTS